MSLNLSPEYRAKKLLASLKSKQEDSDFKRVFTQDEFNAYQLAIRLAINSVETWMLEEINAEITDEIELSVFSGDKALKVA